MKHMDMLGQPCPIPVIQARRAMQAGEDRVTVDVDNEVAVQNLEKMAQGEGYRFAWEGLGEGRFRVELHKNGMQGDQSPKSAIEGTAQLTEFEAVNAYCGPRPGMTVLIGQDHLGEGAEELGRMLIKGFLFSLTELPIPPRQVIFLNGGAHLTTEGANTVPDLRTLEQKGTEIYTCGTCANFFGIKEKLAVGTITDMMNIVRMLAEAADVVSI